MAIMAVFVTSFLVDGNWPIYATTSIAYAATSYLMLTASPKRWKWAASLTVFGACAGVIAHVWTTTPRAYLDQSAIQAGGCILGLFGGWAMGTIVKKHAAARREAARKLALTKFGTSGTIKEFPVKSRMIEAIYFCQENGQLRIRLNNGQDRLFDGVSETDALAISSARSPGDYYLKTFKGRYKKAA